MITIGRRWLDPWIPWPLAILHIGTVASVATLGPLLSGVAAVSVLFFVACVTAPMGFVVFTLAVSQFSDLPGLSDLAVFGLKWAISGVMFGVLVARYAIERRSIDLHLETPERVLILFAVWCFICTMFSVHKTASLAEAARIAVYPILVIIVRETLTSRRDIVLALLGYALAAVLGTVYSVSSMNEGFGRFAGFSGNANIFGLFLSFAVPVLVAAWFACRGFFLRVVLQMSAALGVVALALSWSRASMLSIVVQAVVASVLFKRFKLVVAGVVLAISILAVILFTPSARGLLFSVFRLQAGTTHRTLLWDVGFKSAMESPLVGHGFGLQVADVVPQVQWGNWQEAFVFKSSVNSYNAHNLYIHLVQSAGVPGLALFAALVWTMCRRHLNAGRSATTQGLRIANFTIVAMVIGSIFNGLFESAVMIGRGAISNYFWIAVGIVAAYERIEREAAVTEAPPT